MSFNSSEKQPIVLNTHAGTVTVLQCTEYIYLGCVITSDGKISSSVSKHVSTRGKATNKLVRFFDKNENAPFPVKKTVTDACFYTSLLYGCESWLEEKVSPDLEQLYLKGVKCLLGVRPSTPRGYCATGVWLPVLACSHQVLAENLLRKDDQGARKHGR